MGKLVPYPVGADAVCARATFRAAGDGVDVDLRIDSERWLLNDSGDTDALVRRAIAWELFLLQRDCPPRLDRDAPCSWIEVVLDGIGRAVQFGVAPADDGPTLGQLARRAARAVMAG